MKKIGIVGSRAYPRLDRVRAYVAKIGEGITVVSGGASGVDKTAEKAARSRGIPVEILPVGPQDWKIYGLAAGPMRNTEIVERSDMIVAFWDGESTGTLDTIRKAAIAGKKVVIYGR